MLRQPKSPPRARLRPLARVVAAAFATALTGPAAAANVSWALPGSGDWATAANWSSSPLLPTALDNVSITLAGVRTVTVSSGSAAAGTLTLSGGNRLAVSGGQLTVLGNMGSTQPVTVSGGTLVLNGLLSNLGGLDLSAGSLSGSGAVVVGGPMNVSGGVLAGSGTVNLAGTLGLGAPLRLDGGRTLVLNANQSIGNFAIDLNGGTAAGAGTLVVGTGRTFEDKTTTTSTVSATNRGVADDGSTALLRVDGTWKQSGSGTTTISAPLASIGTLSVEAGLLRLTGAFSLSGSVVVAKGGVLEVAAPSVLGADIVVGPGSRLSLAGQFDARLTGGGISPSGLPGTGLLEIAGTGDGVTLRVEAPYTVSTAATLDNAVVWGTKSLTFNGPVTIGQGGLVARDPGEIVFAGGLTIPASANLARSDALVRMDEGRTIRITGGATLADMVWTLNEFNTGNKERVYLINAAGSTVVNTPAAGRRTAVQSFIFPGGENGLLTSEFVNEGTWIKNGEGFMHIGVDFTNRGLFRIDTNEVLLFRNTVVDGGTIEVRSGAKLSTTNGNQTTTLTNGGAIRGTGTVELGTWTLAAPGAATVEPNVVTRAGTVTSFTSGGVLTLAGGLTVNNVARFQGTGVTVIGGTFVSNGALDVREGTLRVKGTAELQGAINIAEGATLTLDSFLPGTRILPGTALSGTGTLNARGGDVHFTGDVTLPWRVLSQDGAFFTDGTLTYSGGFDMDFSAVFTGGTHVLTSLRDITASAFLRYIGIDGGATVELRGRNVINGLRVAFNWGELAGIQAYQSPGSGTLRVAGGAELVVNTSAGQAPSRMYALVPLSADGQAARFLNEGFTTVAGGGVLQIEVGSTNRGALIADGSLIRIAASSINSGGIFLSGAAGLEWTAGTHEMQPGSFLGGGTFTLSAPASLGFATGQHGLRNGSIIGTGTITVSPDALIDVQNFSLGAPLVLSGGELRATGATNTLSGPLQVTQASSLTRFGTSDRFTLTGPLDVQAGSLTIRSLVDLQGTIQIASGAEMALLDHGVTLLPATVARFDTASVTGAGTLRFNETTVSFLRDISIGTALQIGRAFTHGAGNVTVSGETTLTDHLGLIGAGNGDWRFNGRFTATGTSGGALLPLRIDDGRTLTFAGGARFGDHEISLNPADFSTLAGGSPVGGRLVNASGSTLAFSPTGLAAITANDWGIGDNGRTALFTNAGTLLMDGTGTLRIAAPFISTGMIDIMRGSVALADDATLSGVVLVRGGASLEAPAPLPGATRTITIGRPGLLLLDAGPTTFGAPVVLDGRLLLTVEGGGTVTFAGGLSRQAGFNEVVPLRIDDGRTVVVSGGADFTEVVVQLNAGNGGNSLAGRLVNAAGSTMHFTSNALPGTTLAGVLSSAYSSTDSGADSLFTNEGLLRTGGTGQTVVTSSFVSTGRIQVDEGTLAVGGPQATIGGTVNVAAGARFEAGTTGASPLVLLNPSFDVAGTVALTGRVDVASARFIGPGMTQVLGTLVLQAPDRFTGLTIDLGHTLRIDGVLELVTGRIDLNPEINQSQPAGRLVVSVGGRLEDRSDRSLLGAGSLLFGSGGVSDGFDASIRIDGAYRKTGPGVTSVTSSVAVAGTVSVAAGQLSLQGGGTLSGALSTEAAGTIRFLDRGFGQEAPFLFTNGSSLSGVFLSGTSLGAFSPAMVFAAGRHALSGALTGNARVTVSPGALLDMTDFTFGAGTTMTLAGGELRSATQATIASNIDVTAESSFTGPGSIRLTGALSSTGPQQVNVDLGHTLRIGGTASLSDFTFNLNRFDNPGLLAGNLVIEAGATFVDNGTASFVAPFRSAQDTGAGALLTIAGTYRKASGFTNIAAPLLATGRIEVAGSARVDVTGTYALSGATIDLAPGSLLVLGNSVSLSTNGIDNTSISGDGRTVFRNSNINLGSDLTIGTLAETQTTSFRNVHALRFERGLTVAAGTLSLFRFAGTTTFDQSLHLMAGSRLQIDESQSVRIAGGGTLDNFIIDLNPVERGTTGGRLTNLSGSELVDVSAGASRVQAPAYLTDPGTGARFDNQGFYRKTGAGTTTFDLPLHNAGRVDAQAGQLLFSGGLQGSGALSISNDARVRIGSASTAGTVERTHGASRLELAADLTINGDFINGTHAIPPFSGNAFDRRAGIIGSGQLLAGGAPVQTVVGNGITGGSTATPTITLGSIRSGTVNQYSFSVTNTGTGPALRGALQTAVNGGNLVDPQLTFAAVNFAPGSTHTIGFTPSGPGALSLLPDQKIAVVSQFDNIATQLLSIEVLANAKVYTPAVLQQSLGNVDFGIVRVGDVATRTVGMIANTASATALNDVLATSFSGTGAPFALSPVPALGAGQSTTLAATLGTNTAGTFSRGVSAAFASHNPDMDDLALGSAAFTLTGQVNNLASGAFRLLSGPGTLVERSAGSFLLDFGDIAQGATGLLTARIAAWNRAPSGAPSDRLLGLLQEGSGAGGVFAYGGFSGRFDLGTDAQSAELLIDLDTTRIGQFQDSLLLADLFSSNGFLADLGLASVRLDLQLAVVDPGTSVIPLPPTAWLMLGGLVALGAAGRRRPTRDRAHPLR